MEEISQELRDKYWAVVKRTRISGRIAPSVIARVEKSWERFDQDVVEEALRIHLSRYDGYKENYTIGIMKNLQKEKAAGREFKQGKKNPFNQFEKKDIDWTALEEQLTKM